MGSGPSEGDTEWGVGRFVLAVLLLAAAETVVTSLVRAVLPGWVAAVVTGLLGGSTSCWSLRWRPVCAGGSDPAVRGYARCPGPCR